MPHKGVAIVPAAGLGRRFGEERNKPFETLGGKAVVLWALEVLENMEEVREIIPVLKEADMHAGMELFNQHGITKVRRVAPGGRERQDSVFNALHFIRDKTAFVLIHDGVRPLLEARMVRRALKALSGCDGVVIGLPPKDTIKEVAGGMVRQTLKRDALIAVQTPQVFLYQPLFDAYERAMKEAFYATDDASLVVWNGGRIRVVSGGHTNIKVTTPEDLVVAEVFLKMPREES